MRRPTELLLAFVLTSLAAAPLAAEDYLLSISSATAPAGAEVELSVGIQRLSASPAALVFSVEYDASKLLVDGLDTSQTGLIHYLLPASVHETTVVQSDQGRIGFAVYHSTLPLLSIPDGPVVHIPFRVKTGAQGYAFARISSNPPPDGADGAGRLLVPLVATAPGGVTISVP